MTAPRPRRAPRGTRYALVALVVAVIVVGVGAVVVLGTSRDHSFAAGAPTVTSDPTSPTSRPTSHSTSRSTPTPQTTLHLLGLGDSVTAAANCNCTDFITALGRRLADADDRPVASVNQGVSGATAADLDDDLGSDDDLRASVAQSDIIVVTIGANDLSDALDSFEDGGCSASCSSPDVDAMTGHLDSAVRQIKQLRGTAPTTILLTTYWNVFTDGQVAADHEPSGYFAWSDQLTRTANDAICGVARDRQVGCVDLYTPFEGKDGDNDPTDLLADDGDHPNAAGEELITTALFEALTRPVGQASPG